MSWEKYNYAVLFVDTCIACLLFIAARVRSKTGGYVFTGVCSPGLWSLILSREGTPIPVTGSVQITLTNTSPQSSALLPKTRGTTASPQPLLPLDKLSEYAAMSRMVSLFRSRKRTFLLKIEFVRIF